MSKIIGAVIVLMLIVAVIIVLAVSDSLQDEQKTIGTKKIAENIIDFQNTEHSCEELKELFVDSYAHQYKFETWERELNYLSKEKWIEQSCIDREEFNNIIHVRYCIDPNSVTYDTVDCELSRMKYPELYENPNPLVLELVEADK